MAAVPAVRESGVFVVSLDLELFWGVHDIARLEDRREALLRTRTLVPELLDLFERYGVHATWAAVGFLFFRTREGLQRNMPKRLPRYSQAAMSPYPHIGQIGEDEAEDPYHFAPSLLEAIRRTPHQEIASHTFSHFYCLEEEQSLEAFREDLAAAAASARQFGVTVRSLVFPRNQVDPAHLEIARELGFVAYRGTEHSWLHRPRSHSSETRVRRLARLADAYFNLTGHHVHAVGGEAREIPVNIPASRLLRRFLPPLRWLKPLRTRRITRAMTCAARQGKIFHLWMHPEELAEHPGEMLAMLEEILAHYRDLRLAYGMRSLSMGEAADRIPGGREAEEAAAVLSAASEEER